MKVQGIVAYVLAEGEELPAAEPAAEPVSETAAPPPPAAPAPQPVAPPPVATPPAQPVQAVTQPAPDNRSGCAASRGTHQGVAAGEKTGG